MCVLWVKSIQLALGNLDVSAKLYILQRTKQYLIIYILYVRATTVLFISLKIGVNEKWEPWVLLNLNSIEKIGACFSLYSKHDALCSYINSLCGAYVSNTEV